MTIRLFVLAICGLLASAAAAEPAAGIDFTRQLLGLDHKPLLECKEPDGKACKRSGPITLGEIAAAALITPERDVGLEVQVRRARLAQRVLDAKSVTLTAEETTMIKDQVGKLGVSPVLVLDVVEALDPAASPAVKRSSLVVALGLGFEPGADLR